METLHFWFVCACIAILFVGTLIYVMYFFGVRSVYDYFNTNSTGNTQLVGAIFFLYYFGSACVVFVELVLGGVTNRDGTEMWVFLFILSLIPPVLTSVVLIIWGIRSFFKSIHNLHCKIVNKRKV